MSTIIERLSDMSFLDLVRALVDAQYYDYFFPFMLLFAVYFHVLYRVLGKKGKNLFSKSAAIIIALVVSFYSVIFEFPSGYTLANLMMMLFPNISAISIAILALYVMGAVLGVDFFRNMFRKDANAYTTIFLGFIALGSVIYYCGIVLGIFDLSPTNQEGLVGTIIAVALLILGVVFLIIGWLALALFALYVGGSFLYNLGSVPISDLLFDPFLFVFFIFFLCFNWLFGEEEDPRVKLERDIASNKETVGEIEERYGRQPKEGEDLLYDINKQALESNEKALENLNR